MSKQPKITRTRGNSAAHGLRRRDGRCHQFRQFGWRIRVGDDRQFRAVGLLRRAKRFTVGDELSDRPQWFCGRLRGGRSATARAPAGTGDQSIALERDRLAFVFCPLCALDPTCSARSRKRSSDCSARGRDGIASRPRPNDQSHHHRLHDHPHQARWNNSRCNRRCRFIRSKGRENPKRSGFVVLIRRFAVGRPHRSKGGRGGAATGHRRRMRACRASNGTPTGGVGSITWSSNALQRPARQSPSCRDCPTSFARSR